MENIKENKECAGRTGATFRTLINKYGPENALENLTPVLKQITYRQMFIEFIEIYYPDFFEDNWYEFCEYSSLANQFGGYMCQEHGHSRYGNVVREKIKEYVKAKIEGSL